MTMTKLLAQIKLLAPGARTRKACGAFVVALATYLYGAGVLTGDESLADLTTLDVLGAVVFLGATYGITYALPNASRPARATRRARPRRRTR